MPKLRSDDGSERHTENNDDGSERQTEDATLNVNLKTHDGFERRNWKYDEDSSEH